MSQPSRRTVMAGILSLAGAPVRSIALSSVIGLTPTRAFGAIDPITAAAAASTVAGMIANHNRRDESSLLLSSNFRLLMTALDSLKSIQIAIGDVYSAIKSMEEQLQRLPFDIESFNIHTTLGAVIYAYNDRVKSLGDDVTYSEWIQRRENKEDFERWLEDLRRAREKANHLELLDPVSALIASILGPVEANIMNVLGYDRSSIVRVLADSYLTWLDNILDPEKRGSTAQMAVNYIADHKRIISEIQNGYIGSAMKFPDYYEYGNCAMVSRPFSIPYDGQTVPTSDQTFYHLRGLKVILIEEKKTAGTNTLNTSLSNGESGVFDIKYISVHTPQGEYLMNWYTVGSRNDPKCDFKAEAQSESEMRQVLTDLIAQESDPELAKLQSLIDQLNIIRANSAQAGMALVAVTSAQDSVRKIIGHYT